MIEPHLFRFEQDFVDSLRCIPMAVRYKLDAVAVKLSLRQWSRFTLADRQLLLRKPCTSADEQAAYRAFLEDLVAHRAGERAKPLAETPCGSWRASIPPEQVSRYACELGLGTPVEDAWPDLSELQRFVLVKLSRDNHDNVNFVPACREFGLIPGQASVS